MYKFIRILEVPLLLLILALECMQESSYVTFVFLMAVSITRLIVNVITDDTIYKR